MTQEFWYLSRAAGFTAYLLLFVSVALGIAIGTRLADRIAKRSVIFDLHRFTAVMALAFSLSHVYILLLDGFFNFNVWELSLPFLSPYRAWQTTVGVFTLYALGLLILSFYVRRFIGYRAWRAIHFVTFAMFAAATLHGITAGTDTTEAWAKAIYVVTGAATVALIMYRVQYRIPDTSTMRTLRLGAGITTVIVVAALLFGTGMLSGDRNSATTTNARAVAVSPTTGGGDAYPFLASFDNDFSGRYTRTRNGTSSRLVIDGTAAGDLPARLHVELVQSTAATARDDEYEDGDEDEDGESRTATTVMTNTAELLDAASGAVLCAGELTSLDDGYMRATCDGSGPYQGVRISISSRMQAGAEGSLTGALSGKMQRLS